MLKISIITLFPEAFDQVLNFSILKNAQKKGLVQFDIINLRDFGQGTHKTVDDRPFGGGVGMIIKPNVLAGAWHSIQKKSGRFKTILTSPAGQPFKQALARKLAKLDQIIIIAGHYEGVDQRFIDKYVDLELSIGDYVLTGGEIPAMVISDAVVRLVPGVLEKKAATEEESFSQNLLEYPQYTRPEVFEAKSVPAILLSGNHQEIANWRKKKSLQKTRQVRPDLLKDH